MKAADIIKESEYSDDRKKESLNIFDSVLADLCKLIEDNQKTDSEQYGMVGACVLDNKGNKVSSTSTKEGDKWRHAERNAMDLYRSKYGEIPESAVIVTTLSPCDSDMDDRYSSSCTGIIDDADIKRVYCGYIDPTQDNKSSTFTLKVTKNVSIKDCCKKFAWTFLGDEHHELKESSVLTSRHTRHIFIEAKSADYMAGHCHVMAMALKQLHPDWQIRARIGWEDDSDDDEYLVDHVYIVAPDGAAYDCRGRFENEQALIGPDETNIAETQLVDYSLADIKADIARDELKKVSKQDIAHAIKFAKQIIKQDMVEVVNIDAFKRGFEQTEEFGKYTLTAGPGRFLLHQKPNEPSEQFTIKAHLGKLQVGWVNFEIRDDHLEALDLYIDPKHRRKGIATAMYQFAKKIGNDIKPSEKQTSMGKQFWASKSPVSESADTLYEVVIDNVNGAGAVPYNQDIDYFGLRVKMKPDTFLALALPLGHEHDAKLEKYISDGGAIGAPFLDIAIPQEWDKGDFSKSAKVTGHDGRNRMSIIKKLEGNIPVEVHLLPKGGYRSADLTPEFIEHLNAGLVVQSGGKILQGPLFSLGVTENFDDTTDRSIDEEWSKKYKDSINCSNPKGFSQKAHCAGKKKNESINENFADGKHPERKGDSARHGIPKGASLAQLDKIGHGSGRKAQLARWQANMKRGRAKNEDIEDVEEGWKEWAAAGAIGLGGLGALSTNSIPDKDAQIDKPDVVQQAPVEKPKEKEVTTLTPNKKSEELIHRAAKAAGIEGTELAQFMAQTKHESADFSRMKEAGSSKYFTKKYDPKYAPGTAKILGNKHVGDGERYHGRGYIQITGRDNYRMAGKALGLPLEDKPELAARPDIAAKIAVWFWQTRVAPNVQNFDNIKAVTRKINPALRGLEDRYANFVEYKKLL